MTGKIAIIGSDSFLAKQLILAFQTNFQISGFSRSNRSSLNNHFYFDYPNTTLNFEMLLGFECVIYCAGAGVQSEHVANIYQVNAYLPIDIALFLNANNFKGKLITFGTYFEIGKNVENKMFTENDVVQSLLPVPNDYCVSKRLLSRFFDSSTLSINFYHMILPTIFGFGENKSRLIPYVIDCLQKSTNPTLTSGQQIRQYLHVKDLVTLIYDVINQSILPAGIYNIQCFKTLKVKDIIQSVHIAMGKEELPWFAGRNRYDESMKILALECTKLTASKLAWKPSISIESSIIEYL